VIIALASSSYLIYELSFIREVFSTEQFIYSFLVVLGLSISVILYSFLSSFNNMQKNKEILAIESELPVALFQLSISSDIGKPVEKNIEDMMPRIRTLKINQVFNKIIYNITSSGMTLNSAIFESKVGALYLYPSKIISTAFHLMVDVSKRGMASLALALKSMSEFLKDADDVNNAAEEILSESTSDMQIQALVFAPLAAGIVVGLMAIVIYIFSFFGQSMQDIQQFFGNTPLGTTGAETFSFLFNIGKQMPFHYFQIVVGIYMVEIIYLLSYFLGELNYGDDEVSKLFSLGKTMLIGIVIYSVVVCALYFGITSLMNLSELGGVI